jgi:hypothetical protein
MIDIGQVAESLVSVLSDMLSSDSSAAHPNPRLLQPASKPADEYLVPKKGDEGPVRRRRRRRRRN